MRKQMSAQSNAREKQGYTAKAIPMTCGNCAHFLSERVNKNAAFMGQSGVSEYWENINMRCGIGGFAVKKMGTCNEFAGKPDK